MPRALATHEVVVGGRGVLRALRLAGRREVECQRQVRLRLLYQGWEWLLMRGVCFWLHVDCTATTAECMVCRDMWLEHPAEMRSMSATLLVHFGEAFKHASHGGFVVVIQCMRC